MPVRKIFDYRFGEVDHYIEPFDDLPKQLPQLFSLGDHLGGIDHRGKNTLLDQIENCDSIKKTILLSFYPTDFLQNNYKNLNFLYAINNQDHLCFSKFRNYKQHPDITFKNFLCSFNGTPHVSRKLLTAILDKFTWFDPHYSSKNFSFTVDQLDGHLKDYVSGNERFYRKFFVRDTDFFQNIYSFGHNQYDHANNIFNLEQQLTQSFVHVVSESMATSYHPFITEKFLYSVVTRGLFITYAQQNWLLQLSTQYGFKLYKTLFDYSFDLIENPVERLVSLMSMISKFSNLTPAEWHDLYLLEQDNIEYNYDHYFSNRYLDCLKVDNTVNSV